MKCISLVKKSSFLKDTIYKTFHTEYCIWEKNDISSRRLCHSIQQSRYQNKNKKYKFIVKYIIMYIHSYRIIYVYYVSIINVIVLETIHTNVNSIIYASTRRAADGPINTHGNFPPAVHV